MNDDSTEMSALRSAMPRWAADGKGIHGDASVVFSDESNLIFQPGGFESRIDYEDSTVDEASPLEQAETERSYRPLEIIDASDDAGAKIRVMPSAVSGYPIPEYNASVSGDGYVWIGVIRSGSTMSSAYITHGASPPADSDPTYIVQIGRYTVSSGVVSPTNYRFGAVYVTFCRDWFTNPPEYRPNIT